MAADPFLTVDQFRALIPCFDDEDEYPDDKIQRLIDLAKTMFNPCVWGPQLAMGMAYWVAHKLVTADLGCPGEGGGSGAGMAVFATSKKVGDVSVSYSDKTIMNFAENPYFMSYYGREYWFMLQNLAGGTGIMIV